jgi:uncharacterized membrane protein HdeD (DUF308 family)
MAQGKNILTGIVAIVLGLLVISFPLISDFTLSLLTGLAVIAIGIWLIVQSFEIWKTSKGASIAALILGIIAIIVGIGLFGKILAFSILLSMLIYIGGFFLIISGIVVLISGMGPSGRWGGLVGVILGILYIIIGIFALNPIYLAWLIGFFLILVGIFQIFMRLDE